MTAPSDKRPTLGDERTNWRRVGAAWFSTFLLGALGGLLFMAAGIAPWDAVLMATATSLIANGALIMWREG